MRRSLEAFAFFGHMGSKKAASIGMLGAKSDFLRFGRKGNCQAGRKRQTFRGDAPRDGNIGTDMRTGS